MMYYHDASTDIINNHKPTDKVGTYLCMHEEQQEQQQKHNTLSSYTLCNSCDVKNVMNNQRHRKTNTIQRKHHHKQNQHCK